jgi:MoxR-like ATPase
VNSAERKRPPFSGRVSDCCCSPDFARGLKAGRDFHGKQRQDGQSPAGSDLPARINRAIGVLNAGLVERDTEMRLLLLSLLCGENLLLLGKPGTAKSEIGRRLGSLLRGVFFERLLTRFSVPEELFGPLSLRSLETGEYRRQTEGYLPTATVAFIDEVFKANSAVLNSLLTLLNERSFDNGAHREQAPLLCLIAASNELPESEELDALYDRFLLRRCVQQVSGEGLLQLLSTARPGAQPATDAAFDRELESLFDAEHLRRLRAEAHSTTHVPDDVLHILRDVRAWLQLGGHYTSDRRMTRAVRMLQVAAHASGRQRVIPQDCLLLEHVLWSHPDQAASIRAWLVDRTSAAGQPHAGGQVTPEDAMSVELDTIFADTCRVACHDTAPAAEAAAVRARLNAVCDALRERAQAAAHREVAARGEMFSLWVSVDDADDVAAQAVHAARSERLAALELLRGGVRMACALEEHAPPHALAMLLPARWQTLAFSARERALSTERRLRLAIPPCGHRIARSFCFDCLAAMGMATAPRGKGAK